mmetsp:Transcript_6078/g.15080  ORF Transcript_6078/g.15080 Transcript_6078/m.15080 type:complete len:254 (+) Transcript_6078:955-1716(+)
MSDRGHQLLLLTLRVGAAPVDHHHAHGHTRQQRLCLKVVRAAKHSRGHHQQRDRARPAGSMRLCASTQGCCRLRCGQRASRAAHDARYTPWRKAPTCGQRAQHRAQQQAAKRAHRHGQRDANDGQQQRHRRGGGARARGQDHHADDLHVEGKGGDDHHVLHHHHRHDQAAEGALAINLLQHSDCGCGGASHHEGRTQCSHCQCVAPSQAWQHRHCTTQPVQSSIGGDPGSDAHSCCNAQDLLPRSRQRGPVQL